MSSLEDPNDFQPVVLVEVDGVETEMSVADFLAMKQASA